MTGDAYQENGIITPNGMNHGAKTPTAPTINHDISPHSLSSSPAEQEQLSPTGARSADESLFAGYEPDQPPPALSADRRRTLRQAQDVAEGRHPLTRGPLHPEASRERTAADRKAEPFTCGTCAHLRKRGGVAGDYLKCTSPSTGPITGGPGTDLRAWWPACPSYQPEEAHT